MKFNNPYLPVDHQDIDDLPDEDEDKEYED